MEVEESKERGKLETTRCIKMRRKSRVPSLIDVAGLLIRMTLLGLCSCEALGNEADPKRKLVSSAWAEPRVKFPYHQCTLLSCFPCFPPGVSVRHVQHLARLRNQSSPGYSTVSAVIDVERTTLNPCNRSTTLQGCESNYDWLRLR